MQEITAADAGLVVSADGTPVGLDYEMVPLPAHRMPAPPFKIQEFKIKIKIVRIEIIILLPQKPTNQVKGIV